MMTLLTQKIWLRADAVCFDVDSTVIQEEAIDELAKFCKKGDEIALLTRSAMGGSMTFQESLKQRLDILSPSLFQVKEFIKLCPPKFSPGIKELVEELHQRNIPVYLVTGGFRSIVTPIAQQLRIPPENIFANKLKFFFNGDFAGFDDTQPTSKSGGKSKVCAYLKEKFGYKSLIMIGDGATDAEACPPADAFIGYGGNVIREAVKSKSEWYITDFRELMDLADTS